MDKEQLPARHQYHLLHGPQCPSKHCWAAKTGASLNAWVIRFVVAVLMALTPQLALSALDSWPYGLSPSYQRSPKLCERLFEKASTLSPCRLDDEICLGKKIHGTASGPLDTNEFIASHAYGYSDIYALVRRYPSDDSDEPPRYEDLYPSEADEIASALPEGVALLFLLQFGGASYQGLRETWKVDHAALQALLELPLPPRDPKDIFTGRGRLAPEFSELLKQGERLSSEISPIVTLDGRAYIVERECSGRWFYGYYACNRIIKLTIKRIEGRRKSTPFCQLVKRPTKQGTR